MAFETIITQHLDTERKEGRLSRITKICSDVTGYAGHPNPGKGYLGITDIEAEVEVQPFTNDLCQHFVESLCLQGKARTILRHAMKANKMDLITRELIEPMLMNA